MYSLSEGIVLADFQGGVAAYDLFTDKVTLVDLLGGWVLRRLPADLDDLVRELVNDLPDVPAVLAGELRRGVHELEAAGLVGRLGSWTPPTPVRAGSFAEDRRLIGATHAVLDHRLAFRSTDPKLLRKIDSFLRVAPVDEMPTVIFDAERTPRGGVVLNAAEEWDFPAESGFFAQLPGVINDFASRSENLLVLHAGAVRTPSGHVVVLPGPPEAGKSTLTAALLRDGCDYLSDELVGVRAGSLVAVPFPRALFLDNTSRAALGMDLVESDSSQSAGNPLGDSVPVNPSRLRGGVVQLSGDAGPVEAVILPAYAAEPDSGHRLLAPTDALRGLLLSTTNLDRCGADGWQTLCNLAELATVWSLPYSEAPSASRLVLSLTDGWPPSGPKSLAH